VNAATFPLRLIDVTRVYGEAPAAVVAVNHVSLSAKDGETLVIIGPSGSGKTTLLSMAGCMLKPTSGTVEVMGIDVSKLSERRLPEVRIRHLGFVFQTFNLLAPLTAEENVLIVMNLAGRRGREARAEARRLLEELGLGQRLRQRPDDLSAGERQRVAIARALANRPDLILADEPTANLDSATGRRVMTLLSQAMRRREAKALVVVSHDSRVLEFADRVLYMEDGQLRERAPVSDTNRAAGEEAAEPVSLGRSFAP
jgi:putative ABC transport system ATP-binding protein